MSTPPPVPSRDEIEDVLALVAREASRWLATLDDRPVRGPDVERAERAFDGPLPETGAGALQALRELVSPGFDAAVGSAGGKCFHFVLGGVTPAALGADWLTSVIDQCAYAWVSSPLSARLEQLSIRWLLDLFGLPTTWGGVLTTGATMANFTALAAARQWWGERHGVDVGEVGLAGLPPVPVLSSGFVHPSAVKCLSMLGLGRGAVTRLERDAVGHLDVDGLRRALDRLDGAPAILIGNAGEVNAGEFDPLDAMADLARDHGAWLHVDGAFGLFARASPRTAELAAGVERADSVIADGHKWLNVPYDCGFAFVARPELLPRAFAYHAHYLVPPDDPRPNHGVLAGESSRRARSLSTWATLRAYGRTGYRDLVERCCDLARRLAQRVDEAPDLERLADVPLNIVCFRHVPAGLAAEALDRHQERLGQALLEDGRFYVGTTRRAGVAALRPALVSWRTRPEDVEAFVEVVREVGARVAAEG